MNFAARVFRSGGRRGGVLEIPLSTTKTAADRLEEGFRRKYEDPAAAFSTVILRDNAKFHECKMTLRDSQSIEGQQESTKDVALRSTCGRAISARGRTACTATSMRTPGTTST